jgi:hypothetical protein
MNAFQQHALEGQREGIPVGHREPALPGGGPGGRGLPGVDRRLVVQRLEAGGPQDRLAQPLQPEDQQQPADHQPEPAYRDHGQRRAQRRDDGRQHEQPGADPGQRRTPVPAGTGGQHDRQRLHRLHGTGQEHRQDQ